MTVTITSGTRSPSSASVRSSAARSMLPLKGWISDGTRPSGMTRSRASASSTSMLARVVSKWVLFGTTCPGFQDGVEEDPLGGAPLVGRDDVLEAGQVLHDVAEAVEGAAAGVGLVALHERAPLRGRHRARPGVGEEVDEDVLRAEEEDVVAGLRERLLALLAVRELDRLDRLDAEGLDDRLESAWGAPAREGKYSLQPRPRPGRGRARQPRGSPREHVVVSLAKALAVVGPAGGRRSSDALRALPSR